jgi:2-polyprenyl-6-methoxyphenol hydroxylase-like FAD-dependent oxidoreductase
MLQQESTEVLVVGAGPVGLLTAALLAEQGIRVSIIDEQWRPTVHSYACALHAQSLRLLDELDLTSELLKHGRILKKLAFYEGKARELEVDLSQAPGQHPCLLVVAQSAFEGLLEERLRRKWGIEVSWNHRLRDLRSENTGVVASIDRLGGTAKGHVVPRWEWIVEKSCETRSRFVVGADGHYSAVREQLGIQSERVGQPEVFAVYEYASDGQAPSELRVVIDESSTNVLWPLPANRCRWSFQMSPAKLAAEFPVKERQPVRISQEDLDDVIKSRMKVLLRERAPWFEGEVRELEWSIAVRFEPQYARHFGQDGCWLVGDAAHQTGPVGMQSMNVGFAEARQLASCLGQILRGKAPVESLAGYESASRRQWELLLNVKRTLRPHQQANAWTRKRADRILPCLPAFGGDLNLLLAQIGLELPAD